MSLTGKRLIYTVIGDAFRKLCTAASVGAGRAVRPRIHDLRHTFAVTTLLGWYRDGADVCGRLPWLSTYLGHRDPRYTYWYFSAAPGAARPCCSTPQGGAVGGGAMTLIAPTLQGFFTDRLGRQRQASAQTVASYRDAVRLLLCFVEARTGKKPCTLGWEDLDATVIGAFLDHLELDRHNGPLNSQSPAHGDPLPLRLRLVGGATPSMPSSSRECSPSRRSASTRRRCRSSHRKRLRPFFAPRSEPVGRTARPCSSACRCPDRPSRLGAGGPRLWRCRLRHRCERAL